MKGFNGWLKSRAAEKDFWSQENVKAIKTTTGWEKFVKENFGIPFSFFSSKNILEVGYGPYGVVHFIESHTCVGFQFDR